MVHPDHETRIGAHRIFSVVLVPSCVCPDKGSDLAIMQKGAGLPRTLSRNVSVFSSSAALFGKLGNQRFPSENVNHENKEKPFTEEDKKNSNSGMLNIIKSTYSRAYSTEGLPAPTRESTDKQNKRLVCSCINLPITILGVH